MKNVPTLNKETFDQKKFKKDNIYEMQTPPNIHHSCGENVPNSPNHMEFVHLRHEVL